MRRGLEPTLTGARLARVEQRRPNLRFPFPERFCERLTGRDVIGLSRRAKYLLMRLSDGEILIAHLGMSGRFTVAPGAGGSNGSEGPLGEFTHDVGTDPRHDHVVFHTEAGARVTYNDPRRFGFMLLTCETEFDRHPLIVELGPEPLGNSFDAEHLSARAFQRNVDLKAFLMNQKVVAGLGNIYVCEALHRAGLSPRRSAASLALKSRRPAARTEKLVTSVRSVLNEAIAAGGSSLRDYAHADGSLGYFQHSFAVYGREGEPCRTAGCTGTIKRIVQAGRSTFFCGTCQR